MEFSKIKGFWKSKTTRHCAVEGEDDLGTRGYAVNNNTEHLKKTTRNNNKETNINMNRTWNNNEIALSTAKNPLETLEEIQQETTSEGYGLKTPYGTHIDLDFVKYCEEIDSKQKFKRTLSLRQSRSHVTSSINQTPRTRLQRRLAGNNSNESLNSSVSDGTASNSTSTSNKLENSLFETRRRLEAFRSFRTKKQQQETLNSPRPIGHDNGPNSEFRRRGSNSSQSSEGIPNPTMSNGLTNSAMQMSPLDILNIRNQMAKALTRIKELETQVKLIPELEESITVLQHEKAEVKKELENSKAVVGILSNEISNFQDGSILKTPSTSSGLSSSSQSSANTPEEMRSRKYQTSEMPTPLFEIPPPVPKRKFCSVGVGDSVPIDEIVCCSEKDFSIEMFHNRKTHSSAHSSCGGNGYEINADSGIFTPVSKHAKINSNENRNRNVNASSQTTLAVCYSSHSQTTSPSYRNIACGTDNNGELKMRDQSTETIPLAQSDASTMVDLNFSKNQDQETSSHDLIQLRHACVGYDVIKFDASTSTTQCVQLTKETSSEDLIEKVNVGIGMDQNMAPSDVAVLTYPLLSQDAAVNGSLATQMRKPMFDKMTMTLISGSDYFKPEKTDNVSSGVDVKPSTNVERILLKRKEPEFEVPLPFGKSINKDIKDTSTCIIGIQKSNYEQRISQRPTSLPTNKGTHNNVKSILRKPGTPTSPKKFFRFADDVKDEVGDNWEIENEHGVDDDTLFQDVTISDSASDMKEKTQKNEERESNNETQRENYRETEFDTSTKDFLQSETGSATVSLQDKRIPRKSEMKRVDDENSANYVFTSSILGACSVLDKYLKNSKWVEKDQLAEALTIIEAEWFRIAAQADSTKVLLEDFLTDLENTSFSVFRKVVNLADSSGNTVLHYAISHGNLAVIERLLLVNDLEVNRPNHSGFTPAMLAALCQIETEEEYKTFKKLFSKSDVNIHARDAGQTALMLAASHGRLKAVELLLLCGAEINATDDDGSTALMCSVEHGMLEVVRTLVAAPGCNTTLVDADGYTALSIAMEAGHKDVAILLYAHINLLPSVVSNV